MGQKQILGGLNQDKIQNRETKCTINPLLDGTALQCLLSYFLEVVFVHFGLNG